MKRIYDWLGLGCSILLLTQSPARAVSLFRNILPNTQEAETLKSSSNRTISAIHKSSIAESSSPPEFDYQDFDFWSKECHTLENAQKYTEASAACEKAITLRPKRKNVDLWASRSNALLQLQRYVEAIASYDRVLKIEPKNSFALTQRCEALSALGNQEEAIANCEEAMRVDGNWVNITPATAWFNRGIALRQLGRNSEALISFERATTISPNYSVALASQCGVLIDLQRYEQAIQVCDNAIKTNGNWGKAKGSLAWNNKALALFNLGRMSEAISSYEQALLINPDDAASWDNQGMLLQKTGQYEKALISYNKATEVNPKYSRAFMHRCETLNLMQKYEDALASCDRAFSGDKNWDNKELAYLWYQRSIALLGLQKHEEALDGAQRAISLKIDYAEAWSQKGVILWHSKKYEDAIVAIKKAIDLNPYYVQGWFNYGRVLSSLKEYQKAVAAYDEALREDVKSVDESILASIWANQAAALWHLQEYQLALDCTNRAIKLNPKSFEAWYNKGLVLLELGKYHEALEAYSRAKDIDNDNAYVWTGIGMGFARSGRLEEALKAFEAALNIEPNYPVAQQQREKILNQL
ncbi:tetratricopeptide repeat protein [Scytonema sp. NUACC26]|uniref:tetratricopeptide repeat protein n=1 Tax=Scytonema sp. NUACC26 TaxID=3140176 RepID=UPI0034DBCEB2